MEGIRTEEVENVQELPVMQVVCMSFATMCYCASGVLAYSQNMFAICAVMTSFSVLCGARVIYLLAKNDER